MPRSRVLVVAPQPFYEDRGTPIAVRQVLEALSQLGYLVDVLTFPLGISPHIPGVRYFRVRNPLRIRHVPIGFSLRKLLLDLQLSAALQKRLGRARYACIHAVEEAAFPAVLLGRRLGVPVIYDMQSSLPEQMMKHRAFRNAPAQAVLRRCERWLLRHADLVISSAGLSERVRALAPGVRVREWRYGSRFEPVSREAADSVRRELGLSQDAAAVVYTGTFELYQGLAELLAAIPRVCSEVPNAVFVLVGADARAGTEVRQQMASLGLNGRLRLVDRQPREQVARYLAMADVLVSPRAYGGNLPLKIFDYLAAGRPIVATDIPTHRSLLTEDQAVFVRPQPAALAGAISQLLRDRPRAERLGAAARAYSEAHLGWLPFVNAVGEIYQEVSALAAVPADAA